MVSFRNRRAFSVLWIVLMQLVSPAVHAQGKLDSLRTKVAHATLRITTDNGYQGSGVVTRIMKRKYVLTAHHVVEGSRQIRLESFGDQSTGIMTQPHGWHRLYDIAVYPLPKEMNHLPILPLSPRILPKGEKVGVAAFPGGKFSDTTGIIREYRAPGPDGVPTEVIFTAAVDKGASGGMIIDKYANLVGIVTAYQYFRSSDGYKIKGDSVGTPSILIRAIIERKVKQGWRP
ncbi:MAG: hypothetical protein CMJ74_07625 [Planctomycetaceae bacterium]|nr:hypothetical protein [Planctomycetaceae bacterium]